MSQRKKLPDLVLDSKLETEFQDQLIVHHQYLSDPKSHQRGVLRQVRWKREKFVGSGGFGSVWLEKREEDGLVALPSLRAVKEIRRPRAGDDSNFHQENLRELEAIAKFSQQRYERCFVQSFGWFETPESPCITMEYINLGDLQAHLSRTEALPEKETQIVTFQIIEGISFMHENSFAHRDLKPTNILVKSRPPNPWWVKITDFGISKRMDQTFGMTTTVKGTLDFMAPELLLSGRNGNIDLYAADMWALGALSHLMLTKTLPFPDLGSLFIYKHTEGAFPTSSLEQHLASNLARRFITSMMEAKPDKRPKASQALLDEWIKTAQSLSDTAWIKSQPSSLIPPIEVKADRAVDDLTEELQSWTTRADTIRLAPTEKVIEAVQAVDKDGSKLDASPKMDNPGSRLERVGKVIGWPKKHKEDFGKRHLGAQLQIPQYPKGAHYQPSEYPNGAILLALSPLVGASPTISRGLDWIRYYKAMENHTPVSDFGYRNVERNPALERIEIIIPPEYIKLDGPIHSHEALAHLIQNEIILAGVYWESFDLRPDGWLKIHVIKRRGEYSLTAIDDRIVKALLVKNVLSIETPRSVIVDISISGNHWPLTGDEVFRVSTRDNFH